MMESRITDLEIKLMHVESHLDELNTTVINQQKQIDELNLTIDLMKEYIHSIGKQMSEIAPASDEAPPPHY